MRGWHGMENGQKLENGKKGQPNRNRPPAGQGQLWPKMARTWRENWKTPWKIHFLAMFCPWLAEPSFPFGLSFSPFPAFGRFPCHASPAWSQQARQSKKARCGGYSNFSIWRYAYPEGLEAHLIAANCCETIFVAQLSHNNPGRGVNFEEGAKPSLMGKRQFERHFKRQFRRG